MAVDRHAGHRIPLHPPKTSRSVPHNDWYPPAGASADRTAQFASAEGDLDAEMVAIACAIIRQRTGTFDPSTYRDRYQEALRGLIEAKLKGLPIKPQEVIAPPPAIDLMAALKRSLAHETPVTGGATV